MDHPGHALVFYETLAGETEHTLRSLCRGLWLEFEAGMLSPANPSAFVSPDEGWKVRKDESVEPAPSKFDGIFDDEARAAILRRLQTEILRRLNERASEGGGGVLFS